MAQDNIWFTIIMYIAGAIGVAVITFVFFTAWAKNKKAKSANAQITTKDNSTN